MMWTEQMTARLRVLWDEGKSAAWCAAVINGEFRVAITRNAVCGEAYRRGFVHKFRNAPPSAPKPPRVRERAGAAAGERPKRKPPGKLAARVVLSGPQLVPAAPEPYQPRDVTVPGMRPCSLLELSDARCRFPIGEVGEAGFHFCGARPVEELPYCREHCLISYPRWAG